MRGPVTAYVYDWNLLPMGQALWLKELETYIDFPPLQNPASYNLDQVMQQVRDMKTSGTRANSRGRASMTTERTPQRGVRRHGIPVGRSSPS